MSKPLLLLIAVLVFFWLLRRALTGRKPGAGTGAAGTKAPAPAPVLVACAHCGVLLPEDEAFFSDEAGQTVQPRLFCTAEHMRLGPR